jgi:Fe-S oxidoreductase
MLSLAEKVLFIVAVMVSARLAYRGFSNVAKVIRRGPGEPLNADVGRFARALGRWIIMKPIWKTRTTADVFHVMIAWGFVFYFLVNLGDVLQGYFPIRFLGEGAAGDAYRFLADVFSVSVLVGMGWFLLRRFVLAGRRQLVIRENVKLIEAARAGGITRDSVIVGVFILAHVGFRFLGETFTLGLERLHTGHGDPGQPFAHAVSGLWQGMSESALVVGQHASWWLALGLILAFVPYFPYSKHFHLIMSGVNFLAKPDRPSLGALDPVDFEDEALERIGVARIEDLPRKHLIDAYACIMCNRCQDACPAYVTGKELSPAALEVNKRYYLNLNLAALAAGETSAETMLDFALTESALWACTTCGACVDICPVGNEPMFDLLHMRRHEVLMESRFPQELQPAFRGMERNGNPWNRSAADRMAWAEGLRVPTIDENPDAELLWWVGCAPSYDPRAQRTAQALAKVMNAAGVSFAVLGGRESCTGDSARRAGNEYLFYEMAQANIETLNEVAPKRIVTTCPHCLHTLGKEYAAMGGAYEVIHHTQLLAELAAAKKLDLPAGEASGAVTFHDPCYLGRHNGVVDEPREVLDALRLPVVEMPRHGTKSFCCGAGGAQMWKEEEPGTAAVNATRYAEAAGTGAQTIAVGCPFCLTMMDDASKAAGDGMVVKDVVEIVAERLGDRA